MIQNGREKGESLHCMRDHYKHAVMFARHDIRTSPPAGSFDLVM